MIRLKNYINMSQKNPKCVFFGGQESPFAQIILDGLTQAGLPPLASIRDAKASLDIETLKSYNADFFLVAAFAKILKKDVIAIPSNAAHSVYTGNMPCKAVDAWSPVRKEFLNKMIDIRPAISDDMPFIKKCIEKFRLDDEDLDCRQFVAALDGKEIVGFGRIRPHKEVYELGCVGVVEERRNQGIGKMVIEYLINNFPTGKVYITTDLIEYFERFGFKKIEPGPKELVEKLQRVCKSKCREGAVVLVLHKKEH